MTIAAVLDHRLAEGEFVTMYDPLTDSMQRVRMRDVPIPALLGHRLREAQRLGLRVKALKITGRQFFQLPPTGYPFTFKDVTLTIAVDTSPPRHA